LEASHAAPLAAAFARSAAGDGERVLLIEGSLDDPELARALGVKACRWQKDEPGGILAVIAGWEWRAVIERDRQPALDLLLATGRVANPLELVTSARFQNLLVEAAVEYDLVVLYAPPAMDPCGPALVRRADAGVLVVDARLDAEAARDAALRVSEASAAPLAAVLVARA
jgi:Mrp family chromosome partitioning ATPase